MIILNTEFHFLIPFIMSAGILFTLTFCGRVSKNSNENPHQNSDMLVLPADDLSVHFQNQWEKPKPYSAAAAVKGNWKILAESLKSVELFNLAQDHREIYNLTGTKDELKKELSSPVENSFPEPRLECCG